MNFKEKLKRNHLSIGSWITIGHTSIVEIMATADFDWLAIDMEHSAITLDKAQELILAIKSKDIKALVRVGRNDELIIKRVMDSGADGVIVPMVNSEEDAKRAVAAVKYPPNGNRGVGLARAQNYGIDFDNYRKWLINESVVIAQIEHKDAIENIEKIISVDGIDGVIIGPYDLSASLGIPGELNNVILKDAITKFEKACSNAKFPFGYHIIKPNHLEVQEKVKLGYSFIGFSIDFFFLGDKLREEMEAING